MKKAFEKLSKKNWTLDLVGANGCFVGLMKEWAKNDNRIRFLGTWKSEEVEANLRNYDVCIVPSRYDGWGMVVAEAVSAGIGVITTTRTGSRDLVESSGAGLVVKSGSVNALRNAVTSVLDEPELPQKWREMQANYRKHISDTSVGEYLFALIDWYFEKNKKSQPPSCPWLNQK